tara:strand:+ start:1200 stop:1526 length:327 start_codon:yes stop_codon:yes gene_type:complete
MNNKPKIPMNLISTAKSIDRTFLAQIRTAAIFSGLSVLLIRNKHATKTKYVLVASIIILICLMYTYYKSLENLLRNTKIKDNYYYNEFYYNVSFAVLLIIIQLLLVLT